MLSRFIIWLLALSSDTELTVLEVAVILEQSRRAKDRMSRCRTLADTRVEAQTRLIHRRALTAALSTTNQKAD